MDYRDKKKLLNTFVVIYLLLFLFFNWEDVSWLFNYRFLSGALSDFFQKDNYQVLSSSLEGESTENNQERFQYTPREDSIEIPKISISAPIVIGQSLDLSELKEALDKGVVYYPDSVLPGEEGQTIILGHSAPQGWPKIKYDWVFSEINDLEEGDSIFVYFNNRKYNYYVKDKAFLERGEEVPQGGLTNASSALILISCWPPGKDLQRIAVRAELE